MKSTTKIGIWAGGTLVLAVLVALALGQGSTRTYPDDSPEAALQRFLQHLFDEEIDEARGVLTPQAAVRCDGESLRFTPASYHDIARITEASVDGPSARLTVTFTDESGLFDEPYNSSHDFGMEQIDGDWLIGDLDERFGCR